MQQSKTQVQSCFPHSIYLPKNSKESFSLNNQNKNQCLFSILPCGSKSKQLKSTINDEKSGNEQFFELSSIKHVDQNVKIFKSKDQEQKQRTKQYKDRKGICLTARKDDQNKVLNFQTTKCENNTSNMKNSTLQRLSFRNESDSKIFESSAKSFHRLNPLNTDKFIYEAQVKLGGKKQTQMLTQIKNLQNSNFHDKVNFSYVNTDQRTSLPWKSKVNFYSTNHSITSESVPQSANKTQNIPANFSYQTNYSQRKQIVYGERNSLSFAQKLSKQQFVCNRNTFSYTQRKQDGRVFQNLNVQKALQHEKNALFKSNFSIHSQKYRNYMGEQLLIPKVFSKDIKDRKFIQFNNTAVLNNPQPRHLQHNQKIQNIQYFKEPHYQQKIPHMPMQSIDNKSRSHLVYSSLTVTQSRQKQIQSARNIYNNFGYILSDSIQTSKQLKQPNDNNTFQEMGQIQNQNGLSSYVQLNYDQVKTQIDQLSTQLSLLKTQEQFLYQQNQSLSQKSLSQLDQRINQLQTLKELSIQRSIDIETLRQFIRVKKILSHINNSKNAYETYLNDQNSWNQYINYDGNFNELYSSNQTSEIHNQQGLIVQN